MALFSTPEDALIQAIRDKQPMVTIPNCKITLEHLFRKAIAKDRRLLAFLGGYSASYTKSGLLITTFDFEITLQYQEDAPERIEDVVLDDGTWDPRELLGKSAPRECKIVTAELPSLETRLQETAKLLSSNYEGICGRQCSTGSFDSLSDDAICTVSYTYVAEMPVLRQLQSKSIFAVKNIWRMLLGRAKVPAFVKVFLAYSYLQQECVYDKRAYDEASENPEGTPSDPVVHLAYGPLVEKRGICAGFAWAFKRLMDDAGVECICVSGYLQDATDVGHLWNLVKLDGQYYHVDATYSGNDGAVVLTSLLRPDSAMRRTHIWDESAYPAAKGMRFDYDFIEDFLVENGRDYLDDGAAEQYMFPETLID